MNIKRITALLLILTCVLTSCSSSETSDSAILMDKALLSIGDDNIEAGFAAVLLAGQVDLFNESYGGNIFDIKSDNEDITEYIYGKLKSRVALVFGGAMYAESSGAQLTSDEKKQIEKASEAYYSGLTKEEKADLGLTKSEVYRVFEAYRLCRNGFYNIVEAESIEISEDEGRVIVLAQIKINKTSLREDLSPLERIRAAYSEVNDNKDFLKTAAKYSDEAAQEMFISRDQLPQQCEKIAFSLASGEISNVFETDDAYIIYKCISSKDEYLSEIQRQEMLEEKISTTYNNKFKMYLVDHPIVWNNDVWEELKTLLHDFSLSTNFYKLYNDSFGKE